MTTQSAFTLQSAFYLFIYIHEKCIYFAFTPQVDLESPIKLRRKLKTKNPEETSHRNAKDHEI